MIFRCSTPQNVSRTWHLMIALDVIQHFPILKAPARAANDIDAS